MKPLLIGIIVAVVLAFLWLYLNDDISFRFTDRECETEENLDRENTSKSYGERVREVLGGCI